MNILFEQDNEDSIFVVAKNEVYRKKVHDELLFAEIKIKGPHLFVLAWEDSYPKQANFSHLDAAKADVLRNYTSHKPYSNGSNYEIEEENL